MAMLPFKPQVSRRHGLGLTLSALPHVQAWQVVMMLFSMLLSTNDTIYETVGWFVCFCHGIYIPSPAKGRNRDSGLVHMPAVKSQLEEYRASLSLQNVFSSHTLMSLPFPVCLLTVCVCACIWVKQTSSRCKQ